MHGGNIEKTFLGSFFRARIPWKRYRSPFESHTWWGKCPAFLTLKMFTGVWQQIIRKRQPEDSVMVCAIWYHLYNLENVKNTHSGVLLLIKLRSIWTFTNNNTFPRVFFTLCKWYQISQAVSYWEPSWLCQS